MLEFQAYAATSSLKEDSYRDSGQTDRQTETERRVEGLEMELKRFPFAGQLVLLNPCVCAKWLVRMLTSNYTGRKRSRDETWAVSMLSGPQQGLAVTDPFSLGPLGGG